MILRNSPGTRRYMGGWQKGLRGVPLMLLFGFMGYLGLHLSSAASFFTGSSEAETGSLNRPADLTVIDPSASGGKAVRFAAPLEHTDTTTAGAVLANTLPNKLPFSLVKNNTAH